MNKNMNKPRFNKNKGNTNQKLRFNKKTGRYTQDTQQVNSRFTQNKQVNHRYQNKVNRNTIHKLNTHWTIYIHNIADKNWTLESYKKVFVIRTIEDFWMFFNNFKSFKNYMFFIMREDIKPVYEDPLNKNGGSYSYILTGRQINEPFIHTLIKMVGETLTQPEYSNDIKGISLVSKKFSVMKIWIGDKTKSKSIRIENDKIKNGRYQAHRFF